MQYALEDAAMKFESAAVLATRGAALFPSRRTDWHASITALDLHERATWARQAADVMDEAARQFNKALEQRRAAARPHRDE